MQNLKKIKYTDNSNNNATSAVEKYRQKKYKISFKQTSV